MVFGLRGCRAPNGVEARGGERFGLLRDLRLPGV